MKTLNEILNQSPIYLHNWKDKIDLISDFEAIYMSSQEYISEKSPYPNIKLWELKKAKMIRKIEQYKHINILFASYGTDKDGDGNCYVLFENNNELFEVNADHCSFTSLNHEFYPLKITLKEIKHKLNNGNIGRRSINKFSSELEMFLGIILK